MRGVSLSQGLLLRELINLYLPPLTTAFRPCIFALYELPPQVYLRRLYCPRCDLYVYTTHVR